MIMPAAPVANTNGNGKPPARFALVPTDELFAPVEPVDWLVDGAIAPGTVALLGGYGSSGKTWLGIDLAVSVAAGVPWLGRFEAKRGGAIFLDWESGKREMRRRIQAVAHGRSLDGRIEGLDVACFSPPYLDDGASFAEAIRDVAPGHKLVIVDSLRAACPSIEENDSAARKPLDAAKALAEELGIAFLILVHSKKTSGAVTKLDPREALRGSSAIYDAADSVFLANYVKGEPLHLDQTKARLGKALDPFDVTIEDNVAGTAVLVKAQEPERDEAEAPDAAFTARKGEILDFIGHNPGIAGAGAIAERMRVRATTVRQAVAELLEEGKVRDSGTVRPRRPKLHAVTRKPSRYDDD